MYQTLRNSKIVINHHIDAVKNYASNQRLYEVTGVGALLLTDKSSNLEELFKIDQEIVCYSNLKECADTAMYYIDNPIERERITLAGTKRTLSSHTVEHRRFASGGYEPVAETLFNLLNVDGFFLEYDDERSGSFEPLRFVPKGSKKIILGLVTTKTGTLESKDEIKRRIEDASKYVDIEQLCLSHQCGFSSNAIGNLITVDDQKTKLGLIADVVQEIWN